MITRKADASKRFLAQSPYIPRSNGLEQLSEPLRPHLQLNVPLQFARLLARSIATTH